MMRPGSYRESMLGDRMSAVSSGPRSLHGSAFALRSMAAERMRRFWGDRRERPSLAVESELIDGLLEPHRGVLKQIETGLGVSGGQEAWRLFGGLDEDLWALLLTVDFSGYPRIKQLLPGVPEPSLQRLWNGTSGVNLATQGASFFRRMTRRFEEHGQAPLADCEVLDFGCGWGRLTRFFGRDVDHSSIFGCDPVQGILDECVRAGVPGTFARSDFLPEALPFEEREFGLVFAFSVFTHLSAEACEASIDAIYRGMAAGGLLVITVRPRAYEQECESLRTLYERSDRDRDFCFAPHAADPNHPQHSPQMHYGETVIPIDYIRECWGSRFDLLASDLLLDDPFQLMLTLRRR